MSADASLAIGFMAGFLTAVIVAFLLESNDRRRK